MTKHLAAAVALTCLASAASAETVLSYGTALGVNPLLPVVEASGVTGAGFLAGSGIVSNVTGTNFSYQQWDTANTSAADAIADDEIWTWGFASTTAYDLTDFSIRLDRSPAGPDDFVIDVSINGGSFQTVLVHDFADNASPVVFANVDLSAFDAVTSADFRLAAFNSEGPTGAFSMAPLPGVTPRSGFVMTGEVSPIPLPAGLPLLAVALGAFGLIARRRA